MTDGTHANILRRMAGMQDSGVAPNPLTSSRAVRLVLSKVAQDCAGLALTVSSVADDSDDLDAMLAGLPDGLMLVQLLRDDRAVGLIALDQQLRAAVLEITTTGALLPQPADDRAPTGTDRFLCDPLIKGFLDSFPDAVRGTSLEGWAETAVAGDLFDSTRTAGLVLDDGRYRAVQMTVELGTTDRQGLLLMVLPVLKPQPEVPVPVDLPVDWSHAFPAAVETAPAQLVAELHRFSLPLSVVEGFAKGTVLPLDGCSVASVRLRASDGRVVARARLGQSAGMRAVRLEMPPAPDLRELAPAAMPGASLVAMSEIAEDAMDTAVFDLAGPVEGFAFDDTEGGLA